MNESTKRLSRLALLSALGIAFLYIGSLLPTAKVSVVAIAGFLSAVALMMYSPLWSVAVYAVTAALSLLIIPNKDCAVYYTAFFGFYPILKSYFERLRNNTLSWLLKLLVYAIAFVAWWLLAKGLFLGEALTSLRWYLLAPLGAIAFVIYDICLSFLINFYIERISGYIK